MHPRLITPSQLALFSRSPVIGAWWEELEAGGFFQGVRPEPTALEQQLFDDGLRHEQVLLDRLEAEGHSVARLSGLQSEEAYAATQEAMAAGVEFVHQASLRNGEMRGSADLLRRIPGILGPGGVELHADRVQALQQTPHHLPGAGPRLRRPAHPPAWEEARALRAVPGGRAVPELPGGSLLGLVPAPSGSATGPSAPAFDPTVEPEDAPGDHGRWSAFIEERLEQARDLVLVANLRTSQRTRLQAAGIRTIDAAGRPSRGRPRSRPGGRHPRWPSSAGPAAGQPPRRAGTPAWRLRPFVAGKGLLALPPADPGDVWFDMEGIQDAVAAHQAGVPLRDVLPRAGGGEPQLPRLVGP